MHVLEAWQLGIFKSQQGKYVSLSSPKRPDQLWVLPTLLFGRYSRTWSMKSVIHFHLLRRLKISETLSLLPLRAFRVWTGTLYDFTFFILPKHSKAKSPKSLSGIIRQWITITVSHSDKRGVGKALCINFLYDYASMKNTSHATVSSTSNRLMIWRKKFWDGFCCLQFYKQKVSTPCY